jgi:uncharacterized protein (UPF0297 family)
MDKITASLASIPSRVQALKETIDSLINQVDCIYVYLNNYADIPDYLNHEKIKVIKSQEAFGDLGDAGKFYPANQINGYHLTCDDDIIYPHDYAQTLINAIERFNRNAIITFHGRRFYSRNIQSYYHSAEVKVSCFKGFAKDLIIDVPGTGAMAYHTNTIRYSIHNFELSNMADIWAAKRAKEMNVPIMCLQHLPGWIKQSQKVNKNDSIYMHQNRNDKLQTEILNSFL